VGRCTRACVETACYSCLMPVGDGRGLTLHRAWMGGSNDFDLCRRFSASATSLVKTDCFLRGVPYSNSDTNRFTFPTRRLHCQVDQ
jgi:hypothetical protein